jgi:AcrR family transcriptional regulator
VPRDATQTRARLLREAERQFARHGVYQATLRDITEAAGLRYVSALNYHFGSRDGIVVEILRRHGDPLDVARGELVDEPIDAMSTAALVRALLVPLSGELRRADGRDYLRIVAQLTSRFPAWRMDDPLTPSNLQRILDVLESRANSPEPAVRRDRVVTDIMLMMAAMAERARLIDRRRSPELDDDAFVANLTDMIVGALEAPSSCEG